MGRSKRKTPYLGMAINVGGVLGVLWIVGSLVAGWNAGIVIGFAMMVPALAAPQSEWWREYWKRYE